MTNEEQQELELDVARWLQAKGYDRRTWKDTAQIVSAYIKESQIISMSNIKLWAFQEVWQKWCESEFTQGFDQWLHDKINQ